mmetsp:Transcript_68400/g.142614  ORF Transcript_68400/g.142614 Transcript_68400/m.142614 type:complete len:149 (-) Transcript_68400:3-449(-)
MHAQCPVSLLRGAWAATVPSLSYLREVRGFVGFAEYSVLLPDPPKEPTASSAKMQARPREPTCWGSLKALSICRQAVSLTVGNPEPLNCFECDSKKQQRSRNACESRRQQLHDKNENCEIVLRCPIVKFFPDPQPLVSATRARTPCLC